jgi:hypothetical protein
MTGFSLSTLTSVSDDEMVNTVRSRPLNDPNTAYAFNRKSFVGQRWINGPGFYPHFVVRLYHRASGHIIHYTYDDVTDWVAKINQVTSLDAQGMYEDGRPPSAFKLTLSALAAGVRELMLRGGILKGVNGHTIAMTSMFRCYLQYLKLNELQAANKRPSPMSNNRETS